MKRGRRKWGQEPYSPSEEDIRQACEEIQSGWTEHESLRRAGQFPRLAWTPPEIVSFGCLDEVDS